jgi:hypothetical protein
MHSTPELDEMEKEIKELRDRLDNLKPLEDLYAGGKIAGKIFVWVGGVIAFASTFWLAFGKAIGDHLK